MESVRRAVRHQRRTLFVLAVIAACFGVNAARGVEWNTVLAEASQRAGFEQAPETAERAGNVAEVERADEHGDQGGRPEQKEQKESPTVPQQAPRQHIEPDYSLPATAKGEVPVIQRIPTKQKVVFLTIDDGMATTPDAPRLLKKYDIKAPMFLNDVYVQEKPGYFLRLAQQGMVVGGHTVDHKELSGLTYEEQVKEICDNAKNMEDWLGRRPTLFRPPYGSYNDSVVRAAGACGMRALVMWSAKANGGSMQYQDGHTGLVPGDIVLMHFRKEFAEDFKAFIDAANAAGLQPENLDDWLQSPRTMPNQSAI